MPRAYSSSLTMPFTLPAAWATKRRLGAQSKISLSSCGTPQDVMAISAPAMICLTVSFSALSVSFTATSPHSARRAIVFSESSVARSGASISTAIFIVR